MPHCWVGTGHVMRRDWFPPDLMFRTEAKQFSLGFIRPDTLSSLPVLLYKLGTAFMCSSLHRSAELCINGVLPEVSSISAGDYRVTIGFLVISVTKAVPQLLNLFGQTAQGGLLVSAFKSYRGQHALGDLQCSSFFVVFPRCCETKLA